MSIQSLLYSLRKARAPAVAALLIVAAAACDLPADWTPSSEPRMIAADDTFAIDEGTGVRLGKSGPKLSFDEVAEDSRCPSGAACVWAGRALLQFRLHESGADTSFELSIPGLVDTPYEGNERVDVGGFEFQLLELRPYPTAPDSLQQDTPYRALLTVDKR